VWNTEFQHALFFDLWTIINSVGFIQLIYLRQILKDRGLIIADDASWNNAFSDFCRRVQHRPIMTPHGKRALKKIVHVQQYGDM